LRTPFGCALLLCGKPANILMKSGRYSTGRFNIQIVNLTLIGYSISINYLIGSIER
jgi:MFS-type transporter involved in bile tolerance (Atg22 family)